MSDPEWTPVQRQEKFYLGAHATAEMNRAFVREEMAEFMECGFWTVLPWAVAKDLQNLRISPLGVKEERDRKPRLICDHTFFGVNANTVTRTPREAMQFGGALPRVLDAIRHADPSHGPVYLSKYDIKDGFYRVFLNAADAPALAVTLPHYDGETPLVAIPLSLTMGWTESPPTFCAITETIADLANARAYKHHVAPHRLEHHSTPLDQWNQGSPCDMPRPSEAPTLPSAGTPHSVQAIDQPTSSPAPLHPAHPRMPPSLPAPPLQASNTPRSAPLNDTDIFVDDFLGLGQGSRRKLRNMRRNILHAIDLVLDRPDSSDKRRNEAASIKKLLKGDA